MRLHSNLRKDYVFSAARISLSDGADAGNALSLGAPCADGLQDCPEYHA